MPDSPAQGETYQCKAPRPLKGWILSSAQGERIAFRKERGFIELIAGGGGRGVLGGREYDYMDFVVKVLWLVMERHAGERDEACSGWEHFRPRTSPRPS